MDIYPQDGRINIHPGEWYFGREYNTIYTVLGSCVALTAWHPKLKLGGMCHYLLPKVLKNKHTNDPLGADAGGRYAETALRLMKQAMLRYAKLSDYQLGLFGGGGAANYNVGAENIDYAQQWLQAEHLELIQSDVGGAYSRSLMLDLSLGLITLKSYPMVTSENLL